MQENIPVTMICYPIYQQDVPVKVQQLNSRRRRKRDLSNNSDDPNYSDDIDEEPDEHVHYDERLEPDTWTFPTASGMTKQQAKAACENAIKGSPSYSQCTTQLGANILAEVDTCVEDLRVSI